jgi:hypothetical protein
VNRMLSKQQIEEALLSDLDKLRGNAQRAQALLLSVTSDVPSELPHPDGVQRIRNAGRAQKVALTKYADALREFNEFVLHGTIPARFSGPKKS